MVINVCYSAPIFEIISDTTNQSNELTWVKNNWRNVDGNNDSLITELLLKLCIGVISVNSIVLMTSFMILFFVCHLHRKINIQSQPLFPEALQIVINVFKILV